MTFEGFRNLFSKNFETVTNGRVLFETDADKDRLWEIYLNSFPEGTNPIYKVRREYDCSCCRHFLKNIGHTVYIDDDMNVRSICEFDTGSDVFQPVMDAVAAYVKSCKITGRYLSNESAVGTEHSTSMGDDGRVETFRHFYVKLPNMLNVHPYNTIGTAKGQFNATHDVFKRSMDEIGMEAIDTVLELIRSNTLYKGEEWLSNISDLRKHKMAYEQLSTDKRENYCWALTYTVGPVLGRIRNHSIGVLLTDISDGMDLDAAVRRYEAIVAPANYKRPKAIFTKKMLEEAQKKVAEMGYMDSLPRRFATLDDISVNNILFSNKDAAKRIINGGNVFDSMMSDVKVDPKRFSRVEEIGIEKFISDVLPRATEVEAYVENRHAQNMVSLIAPVNKEAKSMFKWDNGFSWAYAGNMTDSEIRENVKMAGGKVDGVLRFSIQWNDGKDHDQNDLDAHCIEENGEHIYYAHSVSVRTRGNLDVDITHPVPGKAAVENITWPDKRRMALGDYRFLVNCFAYRGGQSGFRAEIEFDGQVYRYDYVKPHTHGYVNVATVTLHPDGHFSIKEHLPSQMSNREIWGVKSNQFVPVSVVMYSPNYWDEQTGIGHRHYMFMLKGCVNPENPNGFYNEFLKNELMEHKRVFEALGGRMAVEDAPDQLSGLGFSSTKRNDLIVKVKGATERVMKIKF